MKCEIGSSRSKALGESGAEHCTRFCVGGVSLRLIGEDSSAVALVPSLAPFRAELGLSDINIRVMWVDELTASLGVQLFDSGSVWQLYESEAGFRFDFSAPVFGGQPYKRLLVDGGFSQAELHINQGVFAAFPSAAPLDYPLDELLIMHRLTQEKAIELHGCGIVKTDGTGDLFVGHSGAGKSTTTRLWTEVEDVEILSDDRIILRRDDGQRVADASVVDMPCGGVGGGEGLGVLRQRDCSASRTNHSAQEDKAQEQIRPLRSTEGRNDKTMRMYGTPWHGEAMYASPGSAPLARIFILEHGRGNVLTRLSPSQGVAELFARSFVPFHKHEYVDAALTFLQEVVGAVSVYRYAFEPDQRAVDTILNFHD
jgi:hypothetical protein